MSANILRWMVGVGLVGGAVFAYFGISSWSALRAKADSFRPTSALLLEHEEFCQEQAHKVHGLVVDQHRVSSELKASQQRADETEQELTQSKQRLGFMLEALNVSGDQILVGTKVTRKRADVERELENQVRSHRRLEQRLASERAKSDRLRGHAQTLTTIIDEQRALLSETVAKSEAFAAVTSMAETHDHALVVDPNSIEQEVLATRDRVQQLEREIEGRLQPYLLPTEEGSDMREMDWDLLSKHPDASNAWVAQAQEILGSRNDQAPAVGSGQNELVRQE